MRLNKLLETNANTILIGKNNEYEYNGSRCYYNINYSVDFDNNGFNCGFYINFDREKIWYNTRHFNYGGRIRMRGI